MWDKFKSVLFEDDAQGAKPVAGSTVNQPNPVTMPSIQNDSN
jgi:hypothetical protein